MCENRQIKYKILRNAKYRKDQEKYAVNLDLFFDFPHFLLSFLSLKKDNT